MSEERTAPVIFCITGVINQMYIKFLKCYLKPYSTKIIIIEMLVLGQVIIKVFVPRILSIMIDINIPMEDSRALGRSIFTLSLLYFSDAFLGFSQSYLMAVVQGNLGMTLRKEINAKMGKWKFVYFDQINLEDILNRHEKGVELIKRNISYLITNFFKNIFMLLVGSVALFKINPSICLATIIISVIYLQSNLIFGKKIKKVALKNIQNNAEVLGYSTENYQNALLTRTYNAREYFERRFDSICKKQYASEISLASLKAANIYSSFLILSLVSIIIWLIGGHKVIIGSMTIGKIVALINYQGMIANPMNSFSVFINSLEEAKTSIEKITEYINLDDERSGGLELKQVINIKFSAVCFSYKNREKVLSNINFSVSKGETIALVGCSGSGKSTIGKLLIGLYEVDYGCIYINDIPLSSYNLRDIRDKIVFVSQESLFFHDSILKNIDLQEESIFSDILHYCDVVDIKDEILEMPSQFNTKISGIGGNISGGQKKRLEIVRSLLKNADVYIFDETESSLDRKRRILFWYIIEQLRIQGKIIIAITHHFEEHQHFDKIINLDNDSNIGKR